MSKGISDQADALSTHQNPRHVGMAYGSLASRHSQPSDQEKDA